MKPNHAAQILHPAHTAIVVVADAGRARLFSSPPGNTRQLDELQDLVNPQIRVPDHEALSDRRGHVTHATAGIGHSFEPRETQHEHAAEAFGRELCQLLGTAPYAHNIERIYLIAAPAFLGVLRQQFDPQLRSRIVLEVASDLTRHSVADIRDVLPPVL